MKVLSIHIARSIWLFPTNFLNPNGRTIIPAINGIIDRYSFLEAPLPKEFVGSEKKSLEMKIGMFATQDDQSIEVSLTVHHDGLVAETRTTTEDSDRFLEDALTFLSNNFGLASFHELPINRKYLSEIYFTLSHTPKFFSELTNSFAEKSSCYIDNDKVGEFQFMGMHLTTSPDLSRTPPFIRVEREAEVPASENRFFSTSSLKTSDHIKLLEELETESNQSK